MARTFNSSAERVRELAPESLRTPAGHRHVSFPSPPPIGTALVINNHPYEVIGEATVELNDGSIAPGIVWRSRCQHCDAEYDIICALTWTPTRNCPEHGRDGPDPGAKGMKVRRAREKIIAAAQGSDGIDLARLATPTIATAQLRTAATELEEEGFMRAGPGRRWTYIIN